MSRPGARCRGWVARLRHGEAVAQHGGVNGLCGEGARGEPPADDPAERCCKVHCCVERAPERLQHLAAPMEQYPAPDAALLSMLCDMVRSLATGGYWGSPLSCGRQPKP